MGGSNEYSLQNKELNYISKGFLWGLWNLLPIAGTIIVTIKILNRIFRSTSSKVLMFIALIIPIVNIASAIVFYVLVFKRIGGKFLIGVLLLPVLIGISAAISVPLYTGYVERARVSEATSIMGAIITSQKVEISRTNHYYNAGPEIDAFVDKGVNISDTKYFTFTTALNLAGDSFTVTATTTPAFGDAGTITFTKDWGVPGYWTSTGSILPNMLPIPPGG